MSCMLKTRPMPWNASGLRECYNPKGLVWCETAWPNRSITSTNDSPQIEADLGRLLVHYKQSKVHLPTLRHGRSTINRLWTQRLGKKDIVVRCGDGNAGLKHNFDQCQPTSSNKLREALSPLQVKRGTFVMSKTRLKCHKMPMDWEHVGVETGPVWCETAWQSWSVANHGAQQA